MPTYTEHDLKRAFECGHYAGMQYDELCKKTQLAAAGPYPPTEELLDIDTPFWVHNTNYALFVWQYIDWGVVRDKWILRPERPGDRVESVGRN
jgi:hypothetical protein